MQSPCIDVCKTLTSSNQQSQSFLTHHFLSPSKRSPSPPFFSLRKSYPCVSCSFSNRSPNRQKSRERNSGGGGGGSGERVKLKGKGKGKGKENVWSVDNESEKGRSSSGRKRVGRVMNVGKKGKADMVLVSGSMLMEVETVLQTQEPVIRPVWNTFASSVSGIWKGVGAVFSPITALMEPIEIGKKNEHLFDCYTLSRIQAVPSLPGGQECQIERRINWVTLNPYGETQPMIRASNRSKEKSVVGDAQLSSKETYDGSLADHVLPKYESFEFGRSDVMEEDLMGMEPGLVFFEDGSYSRGPVDIPVGEADDSNYYLSPTFKFEQCLVKGCHKRLRIVHTIEFSNGGSDIQIMRVAVYEEQWVSPAHLPVESDMDFDLKPFSQRKRIQPSDLTGSWKVFEVSATPIYGDEIITEESDSNSTPYVYLCTETLKKRSLPENLVYFKEEEMLDMQDVAVMWLPGGITGYVDVNKDGTLCIGVGWYSDEGIHLVMERDYGVDGKVKDVRSKCEVKRRWSDPLPL